MKNCVICKVRSGVLACDLVSQYVVSILQQWTVRLDGVSMVASIFLIGPARSGGFVSLVMATSSDLHHV